ncbi:hypothetical protein CK503_03680 [Aliifodinibius salipaludis]|uniref:TonB-dependent receptor-like beta-barrel domain-containing protein n=1 Tax=Fodinibius salipaludis TaxID=2032627 RepID=A0A2A2GEL4_9BACT|nr:hypothetical protein [Aliifodinibius salipaludis]PAU95305.1 hypothetical protein CK503_03680 [Aliifodinibius salipaludis]
MKGISAIAFIIVMVLAANPIAAQQQQDSESSMLPEIDPQDIEIRSQFEARFPGLRRQPILGFDPNPRVYQIDPNRTPFMETHEQVVANLPVSQLSRPEPPAYMAFPYSSPKNVFSRLGFGSYVSPEAEFWGVKRLSNKSYIGGDFDYSSSDGHLDNENSSFRFFDANAEYATKLSEKSQLAVNGGVKTSFNNMFDLPTTTIPADARKEYNGINLGTEFRHFKNTVTGWKADANIRYYNIDLNNAGSLTGKSEERVYNLSLAKRWAGGNTDETFTVKAGAKGGNYENTIAQDSWFTAQGGVVYERLFNYATNVKIDASVYFAQNSFDDQIYLGPEVTVEHPLMDILTLKVTAGANPYVKTLEQRHSENRFLTVNNTLRHTYRMYGKGEASIEYTDQGEFNFGFQYEDMSDYPIFLRSNNGPFGNQGYEYYEMQYRDAYKVSAYASVVHQIIPEKFQINGKVYLRSPKLKDGGRIPYEEKIGVNSGVTVQPFDGITFEAWADYVGSRRTFQTNEKLDSFILLGGQADVQITERFGAYIKLVNILSQDYEVWQGYNERPFQAYGGVTVKL